MIFSKLARLIAVVAFVLGLLTLAFGIYAAAGFMGPDDLVRYLGSATAAKRIEMGIYEILFAMVLGTLAEINFSIRKAIEAEE
jgi:hypothetical protein